MSLPRSVEGLAGLRAARWLRESTGRQFDNYGPEAQREQQDRAIERFGLVDTGIEWTVAHSGRTVGQTPTFADMMAAAGRDYDVLLVGYVSRFARDLRTAVNARHEVHRAGASILFCDERILSSDEDAWDAWAREAVEAESYSRRLGKRIREGYAAKFRRYSDPGGRPPLGFRRATDGPRTLIVDSGEIGRAVAIFERYATGTVSIEDLGRETGLPDRTINDLLKNPIYNGWVGRKGDRAPAPWRAAPPVDDVLWERTAALLARRARHGGSTPPRRPDLLRGLLHCACGQRIRTDGLMGTPPRQRKMHPRHWECAEWGEQASYSAGTWEPAIEAQIAGIRLDNATIERIVRVLAQPEEAPPSIDIAREERRRRDLAYAFAAGRLSQADFTAAIAAAPEVPEAPTTGTVPADRAVRWLRDIAGLWGAAKPEERQEIAALIYDRIMVRGPEFVGVRLTETALAHGLAIALPERVRWVQARPTGVDRARTHRGAALIPIEGAREWRAAARRTA